MPASDSVHAVQIVFLLLLSIVAVFTVVARRLRIPYPIVLVMGGLLISFLPHVPLIPLNPALVFLIFLPPLLYAAAWQTNWSDFRRNLLSIAMMAIGLVFFTVWGVAELAGRLIPTLDWSSAFVLGAVVATTDAISATSIARQIGLPKRIVDLLEGESLVNDATGLLALSFGLQMLVHGQPQSVSTALFRLLWLIVGGSGIGLMVALFMEWFERWVDDGSVEMAISVVIPYVAYLAGEKAHASGVLSVVACGLYLSRKSVAFLSPEARIQVASGWNALNFMLNGLVFVLIGLQLPNVLTGLQWCSRWRLLEYGTLFCVILITLRVIWMFPAAAAGHWLRTHWLGQTERRLRPREVFVIGWTGMRGVVAIAAAISLPEKLENGEHFRQRALIIFLTFAVILVTVVVQGLTLPALIRWLGLSGKDRKGEDEAEARRVMIEAAIAHLEQGKATAGQKKSPAYENLLHHYRNMLATIDAADRDANSGSPNMAAYRNARAIAKDTVQAEREALIRMWHEGRISDNVMRQLEAELDLTEARQKVYLMS